MEFFSRTFIFLLLLVTSIPLAISEPQLIQVSVSRYLDKNVIYPGGVLTVQLDCSMVGNITGVIIKEKLPIGFKFVNSTSRPPWTAMKFNETINEFNWLFINLQGVKDVIINYTVKVSVEIEEGTYVFEGYWKAVGYEGINSGSSLVTEILVEKTEEPLFGSIVQVYVITIPLLIVVVAIMVAFILTHMRKSHNVRVSM